MESVLAVTAVTRLYFYIETTLTSHKVSSLINGSRNLEEILNC